MAARDPVETDRASHRTVVMLRSRERERLTQLAAAENVSTGEIIRRAIQVYEPELHNEAGLDTLVELWRESTDRAIAAVERAQSEVHAASARINALVD